MVLIRDLQHVTVASHLTALTIQQEVQIDLDGKSNWP